MSISDITSRLVEYIRYFNYERWEWWEVLSSALLLSSMLLVVVNSRLKARRLREPLHYVKDQLGHASLQTTVDVYGHIVPGSNRNAVNKLDDAEDLELRAVKGVG